MTDATETTGKQPDERPEPMRGLRRLAHRVGQWAPTNPIIGRIVRSAAPKLSYTLMRYGYLGAVTMLLLVLMLVAGLGDTPGDQARRGAMIFNWLAWLQLALLSLMAPVFAAGAITQEKDNRTFDILLATPLSNASIVLGSLLSRLFLVIALLVSGLPVMFIARLYGGVSNAQIWGTFVIAISTALLTSSAAITVAVTGVGTRKTILAFYLITVAYLIGSAVLGGALPTGVGGTSWLDPVNPFLAQTAVLDPGRVRPVEDVGGPGSLYALWVCRPQTLYPIFAAAVSALLLIVSISAVRMVPRRATRRVRRAPLSTIFQRLRRGGEANGPAETDLLRRRPRTVWDNPVAWREAHSRAAATWGVARHIYLVAGALAAGFVLAMIRGPDPLRAGGALSWNLWRAVLLAIPMGVAFYLAAYELAGMRHAAARGAQLGHSVLRWIAVVGCVVLAGAIVAASPEAAAPRASLSDVRTTIAAIVAVCLLMILVSATNAAATSMTAEKEARTIDLLLVAPMSSRYHVWGKLRGLLSFVLPMVAVPVLLLVAVFVSDQLARLHVAGAGGDNFGFGYSITRGLSSPQLETSAAGPAALNRQHVHVLPAEAVFLVPMTLVTYAALAVVVGLTMSLHMKRSVTAALTSMAMLTMVNLLVGFWGLAGLREYGDGYFVLTPLCPFTSIFATIHPWLPTRGSVGSGLDGHRAGNLIAVSAAAGGFALTTWAVLRALVRGFDRIVRRQEG
jgi:ABC-type transport system involved in multi-copper enzyme maturation permease subunit